MMCPWIRFEHDSDKGERFLGVKKKFSFFKVGFLLHFKDSHIKNII